MQIQPSFTSKYKYSKNDEERKYNVLKDSYTSASGVLLASSAYGILETINKNSIIKNKSNISSEDFKALAKKGLKKSLLIGLIVGIAGSLIAEPFYNIFKDKNKNTDTTPDEKDYNHLKKFYKGAEGIATGITTFGILQTFEKFSIAKNKNTKTAEEIAALAQKGLKRNILFALGATALGYLIAWTSFKLFEPTLLKLQAWADKQNQIAEKAEELIKQENDKKKNDTQNILNLQSEIINQDKQKYTFLKN